MNIVVHVVLFVIKVAFTMAARGGVWLMVDWWLRECSPKKETSTCGFICGGEVVIVEPSLRLRCRGCGRT